MQTRTGVVGKAEMKRSTAARRFANCGGTGRFGSPTLGDHALFQTPIDLT
jgi:hypothetical protein